MAATPGKLRATSAPSQSQTDSSLPDPTRDAKTWLFVLVIVALGVAVGANLADLVHKPFVPATVGTSNFNLFAGFYVAAQVIERILELVSPLLPWWDPPETDTTDADKAAHTKADRAAVTMGIGIVLGVLASAGFGLFFLRAVGISTPQTVDTVVTGVTIAAGTKPLHDFISYLQNQNTPSTGSSSG